MSAREQMDTDASSDDSVTPKTFGGLPDRSLRTLLAEGSLHVEGQLSGASNTVLRCIASDDATGARHRCVYKPRRGERPLWDFPPGTLGGREVATSLVDRMLGWHLTPVTEWREDGPYGAGMCQEWIDFDVDDPAVDITRPDECDPSWKVVLEATTYDGVDVVLAHDDSSDLQRLAVLDLLTNNADRKGGHVLRRIGGGIVGIDHGLTFHVEPKLRTVLWGWAGEDIPSGIRADVLALREMCAGDDPLVETLRRILSPAEWRAFTTRIDFLWSTGTFPSPDPELPALPWPPM